MIAFCIFLTLVLLYLGMVASVEYYKYESTKEHIHVLHYICSGDTPADARSIQMLGRDDEIFKIISALVCIIEKNEKRNVIYWIDEVFG